MLVVIIMTNISMVRHNCTLRIWAILKEALVHQSCRRFIKRTAKLSQITSVLYYNT